MIFAGLAFVLEAVMGYMLWRERQRIEAAWKEIDDWYQEIDTWLTQVQGVQDAG